MNAKVGATLLLPSYCASRRSEAASKARLVGHGFADVLIRVLVLQQPALRLTPLHMAPRMAAMVASVSG